MLAIVSCRSQQELGRQWCSRLFARMVLGGAASSFTTAGVGANPTAAVIKFQTFLESSIASVSLILIFLCLLASPP